MHYAQDSDVVAYLDPDNYDKVEKLVLKKLLTPAEKQRLVAKLLEELSSSQKK
jgi:hypothetical protein